MKSISQGIVERAHQVGDEEHGALEHADQHQVAALVVAADLRAELGDAALQVLAGDERLADRGSFTAGHSRHVRSHRGRRGLRSGSR